MEINFFHCHQYENTNVKFSLSVYACMYVCSHVYRYLHVQCM